MDSIHLRSVTDPDKDDVFIEIVNNSTNTPIAAVDKTENGKFQLHLFTSSTIDAIEFVQVLQQAIEQLTNKNPK